MSVNWKEVAGLVFIGTLGICVGAGLGAEYVELRDAAHHAAAGRTPPETWCLDGVGYLVFPTGASVAYDREGHVVRCEAP